MLHARCRAGRVTINPDSRCLVVLSEPTLPKLGAGLHHETTPRLEAGSTCCSDMAAGARRFGLQHGPCRLPPTQSSAVPANWSQLSVLRLPRRCRPAGICSDAKGALMVLCTVWPLEPSASAAPEGGGASPLPGLMRARKQSSCCPNLVRNSVRPAVRWLGRNGSLTWSSWDLALCWALLFVGRTSHRPLCNRPVFTHDIPPGVLTTRGTDLFKLQALIAFTTHLLVATLTSPRPSCAPQAWPSSALCKWSRVAVRDAGAADHVVSCERASRVRRDVELRNGHDAPSVHF